jgi:hypothetical protein
MLYFRDSPWLRVNGGASVFNVYISQSSRKREDPMWSIHLRYIAAGAAWRRVKEWDRPSLWIEVNHFQAPPNSWAGLEHVNYWDLPDPSLSDDDYFDIDSSAGGIEAHYYPKCGSEENEQLQLFDVIWRVAACEGRWFVVEMAALFDGRETRRELEQLPVAVTPNGKGKAEDPDADFWKKHATFYLLENIPFGTVMVRVPRNARDPEAYAFSRAQELIGGLPLPHYVTVSDHHKPKEDDPLGLQDDLFVTLDFNGYYEL